MAAWVVLAVTAVAVQLVEPAETAGPLRGAVCTFRADRSPCPTTRSAVIPPWVVQRPPEAWVVPVELAAEAVRQAPEEMVAAGGLTDRSHGLTGCCGPNGSPGNPGQAGGNGNSGPAGRSGPAGAALAGPTEEVFISPAALSAWLTAPLPTMTSPAVERAEGWRSSPARPHWTTRSSRSTPTGSAAVRRPMTSPALCPRPARTT